MNVARLNTSHDTIADHEKRVNLIKKIRKEMNIPFAILLDLEGPKIRTGKFETDQVVLEEGQNYLKKLKREILFFLMMEKYDL